MVMTSDYKICSLGGNSFRYGVRNPCYVPSARRSFCVKTDGGCVYLLTQTVASGITTSSGCSVRTAVVSTT